MTNPLNLLHHLSITRKDQPSVTRLRALLNSPLSPPRHPMQTFRLPVRQLAILLVQLIRPMGGWFY